MTIRPDVVKVDRILLVRWRNKTHGHGVFAKYWDTHLFPDRDDFPNPPPAGTVQWVRVSRPAGRCDYLEVVPHEEPRQPRQPRDDEPARNGDLITVTFRRNGSGLIFRRGSQRVVPEPGCWPEAPVAGRQYRVWVLGITDQGERVFVIPTAVDPVAPVVAPQPAGPKKLADVTPIIVRVTATDVPEIAEHEGFTIRVPDPVARKSLEPGRRYKMVVIATDPATKSKSVILMHRVPEPFEEQAAAGVRFPMFVFPGADGAPAIYFGGIEVPLEPSAAGVRCATVGETWLVDLARGADERWRATPLGSFTNLPPTGTYRVCWWPDGIGLYAKHDDRFVRPHPAWPDPQPQVEQPWIVYTAGEENVMGNQVELALPVFRIS